MLKSFSEFTEGKGYINLSVTDKDKDKLFSLLKDLGVKDYVDDLHVTMMYDRSNPALDYKPNDKTYKANIVGVKTLGEPDSKWYAIALELESQELHKRHIELKQLGFKHSYPEFLAHVSLKYKPTESDITILKSSIDKFRALGYIELHNEKREKIKD